MPARPPKRFFGKVLGGVKKTYPYLPPARQAKIAASVYHKLSPGKKAELAARENPGENPGNPGNPGRPSEKQTGELKLLAYGVVNVYEMNGKAYYRWEKKLVRAPERDYLIKEKHAGVS